MRSLSTLATLFLGLAVVFWAPAAKAHCPHANHPDPEHCFVEPPLPGDWQVFDSDTEPKRVMPESGV